MTLLCNQSLSTTPNVSYGPTDGSDTGPDGILSIEASSNAPYTSFLPRLSADPSHFSLPRVTPLDNPSLSTTPSVNYGPTDGANTGPGGVISIEGSSISPYTSFPPRSSAASSQFSLPHLPPSGNRASLSTIQYISNGPTDGTGTGSGGIISTEDSINAPYTSFPPNSSAASSQLSLSRVAPFGNPSLCTMQFVSNRPTDGVDIIPGIPSTEGSSNSPYTSF